MDAQLLSNPSPPDSEDEGECSSSDIQSDSVEECNDETAAAVVDVNIEREQKWIYGQKYLKDDPVGALENIFFCDTCKSRMATEDVWLKHVTGKRHAKNYATSLYLKNKQVTREKSWKKHCLGLIGGPPVIFTKTMNRKSSFQIPIDVDEPLIGLGFIIEIRFINLEADPVYLCKLCPANCQMSSLESHIIGYKHRMAYFKLCKPLWYHFIRSLKERKSVINKKIVKFVMELKKVDGRGKMIVEQQVDADNDVVPEETNDTEKCVPLLPDTALNVCIQKTTKLSDDEKMELMMSWADKLMLKDCLLPEQMKEIRKLAGYMALSYSDIMLSQLDSERKKNALEYLLQENYIEYMKKVFHASPDMLDLIEKQALEYVKKERDARKYPL